MIYTQLRVLDSPSRARTYLGFKLYLGNFKDFETLEKEFIVAYLEKRVKHNGFALIYDFKQNNRETVRDSKTRVNQYISRCPQGELPSHKRLVSIFLEGQSNKTLNANMYANKQW